MNSLNALIREARFMARDRAVLVWMVVVFCLSSVTVWSGLTEVQHQNATIDRLQQADQEDRLAVAPKLKSWGAAAYYSFHLTYDAPSDFAFAAMGQRDQLPWKHRVRMLALEGQIYERDVNNPLFTLIGRLDFAFLATFILPLILIILLYDVRAVERAAGRHALLVATVGEARSFWLMRVALPALVVFASLMTPLMIGGFMTGTSLSTLLLVAVLVLAYTLFWMLVCYWFASWRLSGSVILISLVGVWIMLAVILPAGSRYAIEHIVPIPADADILMLQRETVNDAWDLPKEDTMTAFISRHPEWAEGAEIKATFEWKWYYAFQQVGDQQAEQLSRAYKDGRIERDRLAGLMALLVPPALLERSLQKLAKTDVLTALAYEDRVRHFHAELRSFYYPKLFQNEPFDKTALRGLPLFDKKPNRVQHPSH